MQRETPWGRRMRIGRIALAVAAVGLAVVLGLAFVGGGSALLFGALGATFGAWAVYMGVRGWYITAHGRLTVDWIVVAPEARGMFVRVYGVLLLLFAAMTGLVALLCLAGVVAVA